MMGFDEERETQQHPWQASSAFGNDHSEIKVKTYDLTINTKTSIERNKIGEQFHKVAGEVHSLLLKTNLFIRVFHMRLENIRVEENTELCKRNETPNNYMLYLTYT